MEFSIAIDVDMMSTCSESRRLLTLHAEMLLELEPSEASSASGRAPLRGGPATEVRTLPRSCTCRRECTLVDVDHLHVVKRLSFQRRKIELVDSKNSRNMIFSRVEARSTAYSPPRCSTSRLFTHLRKILHGVLRVRSYLHVNPDSHR
ncbi:hypothetical protein DENSPDRAFT_503011 [Dentipellis sp. KUC8613]|nr:hypothetical protein DENSPDRAFT_503011 [Dentipellis sp. KUC8613]